MKNTIIARHALFDILNKMPRTGYLIRGISSPETIGEHCFSMSVLGLFILHELEKSDLVVDGEKLLKMFLLHETGEIIIGDIPAPAIRLMGRELKLGAERKAEARLLGVFPGLLAVLDEMHAGVSLEARICKAVDKLQMMLKVLIYESEGQGNLDDFWCFDENFVYCGVPLIDGLFDEVRGLRGRFRWDFLDVTGE